MTTATYVIDERPASCARSTSTTSRAEGGALVIRSGGGRVGESFPLQASA